MRESQRLQTSALASGFGPRRSTKASVQDGFFNSSILSEDRDKCSISPVAPFQIHIVSSDNQHLINGKYSSNTKE